MKDVFLPPPPGYRFSPTDEELITYYLWPKAAKQPLPLGSIVEKPLYGINANPWEAFSGDDPWETYTTFDKNGTKTLKETIYVFTTLSKINNGKKRVSRIAGCGLWDGQTGATSIHDCQGNIIGSKKMLSFETKKASDGSKMKKMHGHWIMHEYSLDGSTTSNEVLCKITRTWKGKDINLAENKKRSRMMLMEDTTQNPNGDEGIKKLRTMMEPTISKKDVQESTVAQVTLFDEFEGRQAMNWDDILQQSGAAFDEPDINEFLDWFNNNVEMDLMAA